MLIKTLTYLNYWVPPKKIKSDDINEEISKYLSYENIGKFRPNQLLGGKSTVRLAKIKMGCRRLVLPISVYPKYVVPELNLAINTM